MCVKNFVCDKVVHDTVVCERAARVYDNIVRENVLCKNFVWKSCV